VQEILGHSSKLMTRYYTNTSLEEMLDAVGKAGMCKRRLTNPSWLNIAPSHVVIRSTGPFP